MQYYLVTNDTYNYGTEIPLTNYEQPNFEKDENYHLYLIEMIFEDIRKTHYNECPSRLNALFLINGEENAKNIAYSMDKRYVYEVDMNAEGTSKEFDDHWVELCNKVSYETIKEYAHNYFSGKASDESKFFTLFNGKGIIKESIPFL
ncbi:DUF2441 domain-containing protein [Heyndrickxia camelliae]|nr:DUF2441 domain-containing protein [Heyndrickxia camelliae]